MKFTLALLATIVGLSNAVKLESKHYGGFAMNIGHDDDDYLAQSKRSARYDFDDRDHANPDYFAQSKRSARYDFDDRDHANPDYFAQSKTQDDEEMTDEEWLDYLCYYYGEDYCYE